MNQWRPFDIKSFLKASRHWDDDIQKLRAEHDNLSVLPSSNDVPAAKSGTVSDITAKAALRRLEIDAQIEEILLYKEILELAFNMLTDEDRELIRGFYYPTKSISFFVQDYGRTHGMGQTKVYQEKARIENYMARFIESKYYS